MFPAAVIWTALVVLVVFNVASVVRDIRRRPPGESRLVAVQTPSPEKATGIVSALALYFIAYFTGSF